MKINVPELSLVVLIGPSGSGKSSFAKKHFKSTEILSSDYCRGLVSDDENDQAATKSAFEVLHFIARKRLAAGRLTVVDATNVQADARKPLVALARELDCLPAAIVLDVPDGVCLERNKDRPDRSFGPHVVRQQSRELRRSLRTLKREGFRSVAVLSSQDEIDSAIIERQPLWNDRRREHGPLDIVGDVHGCYDELLELLAKLGYRVEGGGTEPRVIPPEGRKLVFLGDLVDRGPGIVPVLRLVMSMVEQGTALCIPGNHEVKLGKKLAGKDVRMTHGLAESVAQLEAAGPELTARVSEFIGGLVSHYVLDDGKLVVTHAGLKEEYQGRASARVREFCLYGETTGEIDELGLPVRSDWAAEYRGKAMVVYGHTPVASAEWVNRTICLDTGCVFGGELTALRYPEREIVSVPAGQVYYEPAKPLDNASAMAPSARRPYDDLLDVQDAIDKHIVSTRIQRSVTIREGNAAAALEVMSRFAVDPRWLIYLPPTMSPPETHKEGPYLEHPAEAFSYFRHQGVPRVICEEKHMGSRAVIVLCKDEAVAARRFGIAGEGIGVVYTRTGRPFFNDKQLEQSVLQRLRAAVESAGLWQRLETDWLCLDAELMPWSAKAQELLRTQYAAVGAAGGASLRAAVDALGPAAGHSAEAQALLARFETRRSALDAYVEAYGRYCWKVDGLNDLKLAPFHLLASERHVYADRDHTWHMGEIERLCAADSGLLEQTACELVDLSDTASVEKGVAWWEELTARGGEGMVVKPLDWVVRGPRGLVQPAVKCRGREYLRIIYGAEYAEPGNLERLRSRALGAKRSLALREFALGLEALHRFVEREPLYRVHECVFGVLALESEPVDPRL